MKDAGEIKGGLQTRLMQLLGVSERTVRIYKQLSEQLTGREKQHLMRGKLPFVQARALAAERNQKAAMLPDFEKQRTTKIKTYLPIVVSRFFHFKKRQYCRFCSEKFVAATYLHFVLLNLMSFHTWAIGNIQG